MLLIWKGAGLLVPVTAVGMLLLTQLLLGGAYEHGWAKLIGLGLAGVICWFAGAHLNKERAEHTFYFIPMQYWGVVLVVAGVYCINGLDTTKAHAGKMPQEQTAEAGR